jgi:hypothetical protein
VIINEEQFNGMRPIVAIFLHGELPTMSKKLLAPYARIVLSTVPAATTRYGIFVREVYGLTLKNSQPS